MRVICSAFLLFLAINSYAQTSTVTLPGKILTVTGVGTVSAPRCTDGNGKALTAADIQRIDKQNKGRELSRHIEATSGYFADVANWKSQNFLIAVILDRETLAVRSKAKESREVKFYLKGDNSYVGPYVGGDIQLMEEFQKTSANILTYEEVLLYKNDAICKWSVVLDVK